MKHSLTPRLLQIDPVAAYVDDALLQSTNGVFHGFDPQDRRPLAGSSPPAGTEYIKDVSNEGCG